MTEETFLKSLMCTARVEEKAWNEGYPARILLSGAECTEHPLLLRFLSILHDLRANVVVITNGMWLDKTELRNEVLREDRKVSVQVTNDVRFYPSCPPKFEHPRVVYVDAISVLTPLGRARSKKLQDSVGVPVRKSPTSFNFRSLVRSTGDIGEAVAHLRARASLGFSGSCTPSITYDGYVVAGETNQCFKIGTVDSTNEELTKNTISMRCNACGLVSNLSDTHKKAIGELE
jgi:hypothetical protein